MEGNYYMFFVAALIPMIVGFIWYNPKTFEPAWMKSARLTPDDLNKGNMPLIFGLSYLLSVLLAVVLNYFIHHDQGMHGIVFDPEIGFAKDSAFGKQVLDYIEVIKARYNSFGHGAVHGLFISVLLVLPIIASGAMFERKSGKYIFINWGYWTVTIILMCGLLCQFY